jgi:hypothetical protein
LEPADKTCSHCGREQCLVREESSERLDLIPARQIRRRTVRPVYACSSCKDQNPVQVPMPPQVIDKGICGPVFLAHVVPAKYLEQRLLMDRLRLVLPEQPRPRITTQQADLSPEPMSCRPLT